MQALHASSPETILYQALVPRPIPSGTRYCAHLVLFARLALGLRRTQSKRSSYVHMHMQTVLTCKRPWRGMPICFSAFHSHVSQHLPKHLAPTLLPQRLRRGHSPAAITHSRPPIGKHLSATMLSASMASPEVYLKHITTPTHRCPSRRLAPLPPPPLHLPDA